MRKDEDRKAEQYETGRKYYIDKSPAVLVNEM